MMRPLFIPIIALLAGWLPVWVGNRTPPVYPLQALAQAAPPPHQQPEATKPDLPRRNRKARARSQKARKRPQAARSAIRRRHRLSLELTAYDAPCRACGTGQWTTWNRGRPVCPGWDFAVDPNVIPLGSKVRILEVLPQKRVTGSRRALLPYVGRVLEARDTGPAIVGRKGDLMVSSHALAKRIGRQQVIIEWW